MQTDLKPTNEIIATKAVAVMAADGFLAQTAAVVRPRGGKAMILLTHDQRDKLDQWAEFTHSETYFQGQYDMYLPQTWLEPTKQRSRPWHNAENQWVDAADLLHFLNTRQMPHRDTMGYALLIALLEEAVKLNPPTA